MRKTPVRLIIFLLLLPLSVTLACTAGESRPLRAGGYYVCLDWRPDCYEIDRLPTWRKPVVLKEGSRISRTWFGSLVLEHSFSTSGSEVQWITDSFLRQSAAVLGDFDSGEIPSYLHHMTDPRVKQYFDLTNPLRTPEFGLDATKRNTDTTTITARLLELATGMVTDAPNDLYCRVFYMDALAARKDHAKLKREIDRWRAGVGEKPSLCMVLQRLQRTQVALELSAANRNAADLVANLWGANPVLDLETRLSLLPKILNYDSYAVQSPPVFPVPFPDYLSRQLGVKVFRTWIIFYLLQGEPDKAIETGVSISHLGQVMTQNDVPISRLIGIAIRDIASRGLAIVVLNASDRPERVEAAWKRLEWLQQREKPQTVQELLSSEPLAATERLAEYLKKPENREYSEEMAIRSKVSDSRFQLVRAAAAAWHHFLKTKSFPKTPADFDFFTSAALPSDPFGGAPLRFAETTNSLTCYSVGPDLADQRAAIAYDPTNGSTSSGDITLEVPRERKYPFPEKGVRAANKQDLLRQFPNGLPVDVFADTPARPLGVTSSSPVVVYSYGPDTNENQAVEKGDNYLPDCAYDPTNGTNSDGDLMITIPLP